jgi:hypothetical protein
MWDIYPSNPADVGKPGGPTNPPEYETAESLLSHARSWMDETALPYGVTEFNFGRRASDPDGRRRAALFGDVVRLARADGAVTVQQFHYNLADLIREEGYVEDDAWAALCRESEAARLAYEVGFSDAQINAGDSYRRGQRDAWNEAALYAQSKANG